ncbi:MAG: 3-hydroxyacyl-CoA dehydrogenase NAD-binding domain-containing protein [Bacteroidetes bacterium]|nr:3-hydroxyacyl-CoA dehydrogenase NAD-binding domain-containing protein [Bacteroidota bacterium]
MQRSIKKVAVLGSGVMGSRIACHFAGVGVEVLLLDMLSPGSEESKNAKERNKLVDGSLQAAIKSNPSPLYLQKFAQNISTGNFNDDIAKIAHVDWIIEVVVERLDIKKIIYDQVEKFRKPGTLVSSNTSGIPIHLMAEGRSEDFQKHFCGTHFFNPPRYLRLLEIIPTAKTDPAIVNFHMHYGDVFLGKTTVLCKDTPAFIANRVGVFSMMSVLHIMEKLELSIDEIEAITGPLMGRPKSATFRTADVVGIDTLVKVAAGVAANCPNDEAKNIFTLPAWLEKMVAQNWLGDKTGQGFFKKIKTASSKEILTLNLKTFEYEPRVKTKVASIGAAKAIESLPQRIKSLYEAKDKVGEFVRQFHFALFSYVSHRIPEISDELYRLDDALKAGFGWEIGAFETWDALGVDTVLKDMKAGGHAVAAWVEKMQSKGLSFYKVQDGKRYYYDVASEAYKIIPGADSFIILSDFQEKTIWKNAACHLVDIGDGVAGFSWNTKMNSIGGEVLEGLNKSIQLAEEKYNGLVIANDGNLFSAGANVGMIFMLAIEQDYEELDMAIRTFQNTMMRVRYSSIPVVIAPHGLCLGGGCEMNLHADSICAAAETYVGLVELGIGVIPGGGGTKEFVLRASDEMHVDEPETITLNKRFMQIATAKVATSANEAMDMGILRKGQDFIVLNQSRRIANAKDQALQLFKAGYTQPQQRKDIKVLGKAGLGALYAGINGMWRAGYASDHDVLVAKKLAYVMCGGDLSEPTLVNEQYLLDLEREAFLSLCGQKKTLERIQSVITAGRPIRN